MLTKSKPTIKLNPRFITQRIVLPLISYSIPVITTGIGMFSGCATMFIAMDLGIINIEHDPFAFLFNGLFHAMFYGYIGFLFGMIPGVIFGIYLKRKFDNRFRNQQKLIKE